MKSGIYEIVNSVNGKRYVGSAAGFDRRFEQHTNSLRIGKHSNRHLQSAFNKYGESSFVFKKLLICAKRDLLFYEQRAIDILKPEYNKCPTAGSQLGIKRSAETRAKNSAATKRQMSPEARAKHSEKIKALMCDPERRSQLAEAARRHWASPDARAAQSERKKGKPGRKRSPEECARQAAKMMGNTRGRGVKHTDEWKAAQGIRQSAYRATPETIAKIVATRKSNGWKPSAEHRARISEALKGRPRSEETIRKIAESKRIAALRRLQNE